MPDLKLNDLLRFDPANFENIRIRFTQDNGTNDPMELYNSNPDIINNRWLFWRNDRRPFNVGQIAVCLVKLSNDTWLLTTIKRVTNELDVHNGINYEGEELPEFSSLYGRVIVHYHKTSQNQVRDYNSVCDQLIAQQILPTVYDGDAFPGYDSVRLTYAQLKTILDRGKRDWITALENQKAVYLITDLHNGKLYVGSATSGQGMLLSRWRRYVANGHGGNAELVALSEREGFDYIKDNFQYSILENYNARVDDHVILRRESWWKDTLQSRSFGYNSN